MRNENRSPRVKVKIERGQFYVYAQLPYIPSFLFTRVNKEEEETGLTYISYDKLNCPGPRAWTISHNYFRVHLFRQRFVHALQPDFWGEKKMKKKHCLHSTSPRAAETSYIPYHCAKCAARIDSFLFRWQYFAYDSVSSSHSLSALFFWFSGGNGKSRP